MNLGGLVVLGLSLTLACGASRTPTPAPPQSEDPHVARIHSLIASIDDVSYADVQAELNQLMYGSGISSDALSRLNIEIDHAAASVLAVRDPKRDPAGWKERLVTRERDLVNGSFIVALTEAEKADLALVQKARIAADNRAWGTPTIAAKDVRVPKPPTPEEQRLAKEKADKANAELRASERAALVKAAPAMRPLEVITAADWQIGAEVLATQSVPADMVSLYESAAERLWPEVEAAQRAKRLVLAAVLAERVANTHVPSLWPRIRKVREAAVQAELARMPKLPAGAAWLHGQFIQAHGGTVAQDLAARTYHAATISWLGAFKNCPRTVTTMFTPVVDADIEAKIDGICGEEEKWVDNGRTTQECKDVETHGDPSGRCNLNDGECRTRVYRVQRCDTKGALDKMKVPTFSAAVKITRGTTNFDRSWAFSTLADLSEELGKRKLVYEQELRDAVQTVVIARVRADLAAAVAKKDFEAAEDPAGRLMAFRLDFLDAPTEAEFNAYLKERYGFWTSQDGASFVK